MEACTLEDKNNTNEDTGYKKWLKHNENKWIVFGVAAICLAIFMPFIILALSLNDTIITKLTSLGAVGDFLGGSTVGFLSLASMLFLVSTIVMQKKELQLQRNELELTREELAKSNKQYELTNNTMLKQQFETTLFNMINMHIALVESISLENGRYKGKDVCRIINAESIKEFKEGEYHNYLKKYTYQNLLDSEELLINDLQIVLNFQGNINTFDDKSLKRKLELCFENGSYQNELGDTIKLEGILFDYETLLNSASNCSSTLIENFNTIFLGGNYYKKNAYISIIKKHDYCLKNYFTSIINIWEIIKNSNLNYDDEIRYLSIFYTHFNMNELLIIMYEVFFADNSRLSSFYYSYIQFNTDIEFRESLLKIKGREEYVFIQDEFK